MRTRRAVTTSGLDLGMTIEIFFCSYRISITKNLDMTCGGEVFYVLS